MVPDKFNMVDMGGIDLIMMQGEEVPGLYMRLVESIARCRYQCLYNWLFDGVVIPPTYVELRIGDEDEVIINEGITVTDDDVIHIYSLVPPAPEPEIIPLLAEENGVYNVPAGKDGFNPVTVDVHSGSVSILSGTAVPTDSAGSDGQIYLLYGLLPGGYIPVEYLEINGSGPYIDTTALNTSTAYFEIVGNWTQAPGNNEGFFGAQTGSETTINSWAGAQFIKVGSSGTNISTPLEKHKYTANADGIFIDDVLVGTPNWNGATSRAYYLFAINYSGGVLNASHARIYKCDIYNSANLIKSFVPVVRLSDSVAGMFDLVENQFYENAGTGSFIAGDQIFNTDITVAYLKVNGHWQNLIGSDINDVNLGGN